MNLGNQVRVEYHKARLKTSIGLQTMLHFVLYAYPDGDDRIEIGKMVIPPSFVPMFIKILQSIHADFVLNPIEDVVQDDSLSPYGNIV